MQSCQLATTEVLAKVSNIIHILLLHNVPTLPKVLMFFGALAD
jgi:hypothetical protein